MFVCVYAVPSSVGASVFVSEVAWMGSVENANAEWIELYNAGDTSVVLEGWVLVAEDGQPSITLSGTLGAGQYGLLERTSDDTVSDVSAFLIYTGAMGNSGEVLLLQDSGGVVHDTVDGSQDWAIGGNNDTKDTLQRRGDPAIGAWVTAPRTPGGGGAVEQRVSSSEIQYDTKETHTRSSISGASSGKSEAGTGLNQNVSVAQKTRLEPMLLLDIGEDVVTMEGSISKYQVHAYNEYGKEVALESVRWNFGDGTVGEGAEITHTHHFAGTYIVTASGVRGALRAEERIVVQVTTFAIEIPHADETYIELLNTSTEDVDVSRFTIGVGDTHFRIPNGTRIFPGAFVRFPSSITKLVVTDKTPVGIFYPNNTLALLYEKKQSQENVSNNAIRETKLVNVLGNEGVASTIDTNNKEVQSALGDATVLNEKEYVLPTLQFSQPTLAQAYDDMANEEAPSESSTRMWWWIAGLGASIMLGIAILLLVRHEAEETIRGYVVEEEYENER